MVFVAMHQFRKWHIASVRCDTQIWLPLKASRTYPDLRYHLTDPR